MQPDVGCGPQRRRLLEVDTSCRRVLASLLSDTRSFDGALALPLGHVIAAAPARRETASVMTRSFDGALLHAALARSFMCAMAAASARRTTAAVVIQPFDGALLQAAPARPLVRAIAAVPARRVTAPIVTRSRRLKSAPWEREACYEVADFVEVRHDVANFVEHRIRPPLSDDRHTMQPTSGSCSPT